ncbi:4Fe-4S binding domain-containing protein [Enterobacter sp. kpr-6]|uniref:4Fe-4S binding protein n=1 Tax=Enterobacter sp. kpr-6 TaxID=1761782 RepID=UPI0008EA5C6D|nr:4Fe-4S binding protein [Enterobacter sp. kpr-6]SFQ94649.1 4Fe-4S binding domain-containing protein [Enterobacter sp. kpr-6]
MVRLTFDPAVNVKQSCVRRRYRYASCRACADACPAQAFSFSGLIAVDPQRCIECGNCLFACPVEAIEGIAPVKRYRRGDTLAGPFSTLAPVTEELLLWHRQFGVRFVAMDPQQSATWMIAIARLNLRLRQYGEPEWAFVPPLQTGINASRRTLFHAPREDAAACRVAPGKRRLREAFPLMSDVELTLDDSRCEMCGACWRACPEQAIRFQGSDMVIETARCTGCGICTAVCGHQALRLEECIAPARVEKFGAHARTCTDCQRSFWSLDPHKERCGLCEKHQFGMRL